MAFEKGNYDKAWRKVNKKPFSLFVFAYSSIIYLKVQDASFHTNNLIESHHNQIKTFYFGRSRNLRVDCLVYLLSQIVVVDYQQEYVRVYLGFQKSDLTIQEKTSC